MLEPFGEEAKASAIPKHDFDEVGLPAPEHEEMAREGILPQHALDARAGAWRPVNPVEGDHLFRSMATRATGLWTGAMNAVG